jgi:hypothetical protein
LKKGHHGVIVQLSSLDVQTSKSSVPIDLQGIIDKQSKVFEYIPKSLRPTHDHDHDIHLIPRSVPHINPYKNLYAQKSEIERTVEEMLEAGIIRPSQSSYSTLVVIVNVYAIIIVLCISIDKSIIRTRSLRNTHSQETQHLSWETL